MGHPARVACGPASVQVHARALTSDLSSSCSRRFNIKSICLTKSMVGPFVYILASLGIKNRESIDAADILVQYFYSWRPYKEILPRLYYVYKLNRYR